MKVIVDALAMDTVPRSPTIGAEKLEKTGEVSAADPQPESRCQQNAPGITTSRPSGDQCSSVSVCCWCPLRSC